MLAYYLVAIIATSSILMPLAHVESGEKQNAVFEIKNSLLAVPFTAQAPFANWNKQVFQDGCEEASILMAMRWVDGRSLSKAAANRAIIAISKFEWRNYGEFRDLSAADTAQAMRDYFNYQNVMLVQNIRAMDIKRELSKGNLVIVPVNGQKLNNPFYTPPGPPKHMIVVRGYDVAKREFITNDPGTRRGEGLRYAEAVLEAALQDYPTGHHEPITTIKKVMIVVQPRSSLP